VVRGFAEAHMIVRRKAIEHDLAVSELTTPGRTQTIAKVKNELRAELRKETDLSWAEINKLLGRQKTNHR
jgi:hypothetical protein